jgi:hypothetical protein
MFLSKYSLDRNNSIASLFRTQYTPDFLKAEAEYYGLRNTIFWVTKDLASVRHDQILNSFGVWMSALQTIVSEPETCYVQYYALSRSRTNVLPRNRSPKNDASPQDYLQ